MMTKQEAVELLRQCLPPDRLAAFLKAWWQWSLEDEALANHLQPAQDALANSPQVDDKGEPFLEDCPWCKGAHQAGTISQCPLNPNRPEVAYRAMEAALKLLTGNILNMRTELLVIKAEIMKNEEEQV